VNLTVARALLAQMALIQGYGAVFALFWPHAFFDDFPLPGANWVDALPPFNEHLVRDYGASFLALSALAAFAAYYAERRLIVVTAIVWEISALPHAIFHFAHSDAPPGWRGALSLATLAINVLAPLLVLYLVRKEPETP
jgi:hypothetical protein